MDWSIPTMLHLKSKLVTEMYSIHWWHHTWYTYRKFYGLSLFCLILSHPFNKCNFDSLIGATNQNSMMMQQYQLFHTLASHQSEGSSRAPSLLKISPPQQENAASVSFVKCTIKRPLYEYHQIESNRPTTINSNSNNRNQTKPLKRQQTDISSQPKQNIV